MRDTSDLSGLRLDDAAQATGMPTYRALYERIREGILSGKLAPSSRLPSTRALASELGVARGTVEAAYERLVAEGFVDRTRRRRQPRESTLERRTARCGGQSVASRPPPPFHRRRKSRPHEHWRASRHRQPSRAAPEPSHRKPELRAA